MSVGQVERTLCVRGDFLMDRQLIEEYVACGPRLRKATAGLTPEDLTARPGPGKWSILELVLHLTDSDAISIDRMKRMLTEDNPPLLYADESAYVERLCSHEQSLEDALTLFEVGRRQFPRLLRNLPRPGRHAPGHAQPARRGPGGGHGEGLRRARDVPPAVPVRQADPAGEAAPGSLLSRANLIPSSRRQSKLAAPTGAQEHRRRR